MTRNDVCRWQGYCSELAVTEQNGYPCLAKDSLDVGKGSRGFGGMEKRNVRAERLGVV